MYKNSSPCKIVFDYKIVNFKIQLYVYKKYAFDKILEAQQQLHFWLMHVYENKIKSR